MLIKPYRDDCRHLRLDANESSFLTRQLDYVKAQIYDVLYTELSSFRLFPIAGDANPGANTITYRVRELIGKAKVIANYGDDLPRVNVNRREVSTPVRSIGCSYGWSTQDIRAAMMAGVSLQADDAMAAVRAHNQTINDIAWHGDAAYGLPGLGTSGVVSNSSAALTGAWLGASGDEIVGDVNELLTSIITASGGVERADTVAMPSTWLAYIGAKARSDGTDSSVLTFLKMQWPGVEFTSAEELTAWSASDDAMLALRRDPAKLSLEIPLGYTEQPIQQENLAFTVATESRVGGVVVRYPGSIAIRTGIQGGS